MAYEFVKKDLNILRGYMVTNLLRARNAGVYPEMMVGDKKLEIMPLLRPFALSMVIMFWGSFVEIIKKPAALLAQAERGTLIEVIKTRKGDKIWVENTP